MRNKKILLTTLLFITITQSVIAENNRFLTFVSTVGTASLTATKYLGIGACSTTLLASLWPLASHVSWNWQPLEKPVLSATSHTSEKLIASLIDRAINSWTSYHTPAELERLSQGHQSLEPFIFGVGTSSLQVDAGHTPKTSAWCKWLNEQLLEGTNPNFTGGQLPEIACDAQRLYKDDVQRIKQLGATGYRFSTSWSLTQPNGPDSWDDAVLTYYVQLCDELVANGIKPVITLHHYDDPVWFLEHYQGFETEEGIKAFVAYVAKIYDTLKDHGVHLWLTFNSPAAYAINGYMEGTRPPGYKSRGNMKRVRAVTKQLLEAHKRAYEVIHAIAQSHSNNPKVNNPRVGILKNIYQLDAWTYPCGLKNPLDLLFAYMAYWLQDDVFFNFFKEKTTCLDFIGLNYYSHGYMKASYGVKPETIQDPKDPKTFHQRYAISAEGMYRALHTIWETIAKPLNIPIYITENGIGAGNDDQMRSLFLRRYIYAVTCAIQDGIPVKGYFYWSFIDNYEWMSYVKGYGLYAVDRTPDEHGVPTLTRTLRPGAQPFIDAATHYHNKTTCEL